MGYHVPQAEDVYKYMLRLDSDYNQRITDGFSWSILFLNDGSPKALEFLGNHGLEMCYRTADRIRFVFFSGLDEQETWNAIRKIDYSRDSRLIPRIINQATRFFGMGGKYQWERESWDSLRPYGFDPLDTRSKAQHHISMEGENNSVMPGIQESYKLAQRLGIGRFLPCFLFFSDIGDFDLYVLPMGKFSSYESYQRLRNLIDIYFELNHLTLSTWKKVEDNIQEILESSRSSVYQLNEWKKSKKDLWKDLRFTYKYVKEIQSSKFSKQLLQDVINDYSKPRELKNFIKPFFSKIEELASKVEIRNLFNELKSLHDLEDFFKMSAFLHNKLKDHYRFLDKQFIASINDFLDSLIPSENTITTSERLEKWWRSPQGSPPTRGLINHYRNGWRNLPNVKFNDNSIENKNALIKEEVKILRDVLMGQSISNSPSKCSEIVILKLKEYLKVPSGKDDWMENESSFKNAITLYVRGLQSNIPGSIKAANSCFNLDLKWGDIIPSWQQRKNQSYRKIIELSPLLIDLTSKIDRNKDQISDELIRLTSNLLIEKVDLWLNEHQAIESDLVALWDMLKDNIPSVLVDLEDKLFQSLKNLQSEKFAKNKINSTQIQKLVKLLDQYDQVQGQLVYPFKKDESVLRVRLPEAIQSVFQIATNKKDLKSIFQVELVKALDQNNHLESKFNEVLTEIQLSSPGGVLTGNLLKSLSDARIEFFLSEYQINRIDEFPGKLSDRSKIIEFLEKLNVQELTLLENNLRDNTDIDHILPHSKEEIHLSILDKISIASKDLPDKNLLTQPNWEILEKKIKKNEFDIFLAHNSAEKDNIVSMGKLLRERGIYPWIDIEQIPPGRWFQDVIQSAIRRVKTAAIVIGKSGFGRWQKVELRAFLTRCVEDGIPLIPILLPEVETIPSDFLFLKELNYVRFNKKIDEQDALSKIIWGIHAIDD